MLYDDLTPVIFEIPDSEQTEQIHVYGIGDVHVGAPNWNPDVTLKKMQIILDDPVGYVHLCGDLMNNGLKNSKTNTYLEVLNPQAQKDWIIENLEPLKDRIISAVPGNHEDRTTRDCGISPIYDILCIWGISERFRENMALSIVKFGTTYNGKLSTYGGLTTHGSSRNKHQKFITGFDGIDYCISGHTHTPGYSPHGKIVLNKNSGKVRHTRYAEMVVDASIKPGDYGLKKEYQIPTTPEMSYFTLHNIGNQVEGRRIDYTAVQI